MRFSKKVLTLAAATLLAIGGVAQAQDAGAGGGGAGGAGGGGRGGAGGGPGGGGRGGFGGFGGGPGGTTTFGQRDALRETLSVLGDLNLTPTFTLTQDQKDKIQTIRDDFKKAQEKWDADNKAKIDELRNGNADNRREQYRTLYETRPKSDEVIKQIIAVLTGDQAKALATKQAERTADDERRRTELMQRFGGGNFGRGGNDQGGAGGAAGGAQPGARGGDRGGRGGNRGGGAGGGAGAGGI